VSEKRQRRHLVAVRLNDVELAEITRRAKEAGISLGALMRTKALA